MLILMLPTQFNAFFCVWFNAFFFGGGGGYHNLAKRCRAGDQRVLSTVHLGWDSESCDLPHTIMMSFYACEKMPPLKENNTAECVFTIHYPRSNITGQTVGYTAYYQGHGTRYNMPMRCALACAHSAPAKCRKVVFIKSYAATRGRPRTHHTAG